MGRQDRLNRIYQPLIDFAVVKERMALADGEEQILSEIWGPEYRNQTEYLRVYIGRLRQRVEALWRRSGPTRPEARRLQQSGRAQGWWQLAWRPL